MVDLIEPEPDAIASYPYDNLEEGFGLVTYYAFAYKDDSGTEYGLGKSLVHSAEVGITETNTTVNSEYAFFSGTFARPRVVKGVIGVNFCLGGHSNNNDNDVYTTLKVYHFDGSTATQIGSTWTSASMELTSSGANDNFTLNALIPITTQKKFKIGDSIKIVLGVVSNGNIWYTIGIDPQNRDSEYLTPSTQAQQFTQFITRIPFNLVN
jgi:hypothetical protein